MKLKNHILNIILLAVITLLVIVIAKNFIFKERVTEDRVVITKENYQTSVEAYSSKLNSALFSLGGDIERLDENKLIDLLSLWNEMEGDLKKFLPRNFKNQQEWEKYLFLIRQKEEKALEYFKEKNPEAAREELVLVRNELLKLNPQIEPPIDLEKFNSLVDQISLIDEKIESADVLEQIKFEYLMVKEKLTDDNYLPIIKDIEASLRSMDMYERSDWLKARNQLASSTEELKQEILK